MRIRDDFSDAIKRTVADRVGRVCSNLECRAPTSGPQIDPSGVLNVGVAAHITAASAGGPRYDAALSAEERCSVANAIWLCQNCGKLVDNDPTRYTVDLLRAWKTIAEDRARNKIGKTEQEPDFAAVEQSRARQMYSMGVLLLRRVCGNFFKNQNLTVCLLAKDQNNARGFWRTVDVLGEIEPMRGRFKPHTEPSNFYTDDQQALKAAEQIVRGYVSASENNSDFAEIRAEYELPDPDEVRSLLPATNTKSGC